MYQRWRTINNRSEEHTILVERTQREKRKSFSKVNFLPRKCDEAFALYSLPKKKIKKNMIINKVVELYVNYMKNEKPNLK